MTTTQKLCIDGHKLVAVKLNANRKGTPVILLHGVTLSTGVWVTDPVFSKYSAGPCYALSLPGHYPATSPPGFNQQMLSPKAFVELVRELLNKAIHHLANKQPLILVGHSTGGFFALDLAAFKPNIARGIVSLSGFAQWKWIGWYGLQQKIVRQGAIGRLLFKTLFQFSTIHRALYRQAWRVALFDTRAYFNYPGLEALIDSTYLNAKQLDWAAVGHYFRVVPDPDIDITSRLSQITARTLVVTGDKDPTVPPSQADLIARNVPTSELAVVKGAGHMLFVENPSEYVNILSNWLRKL